MRGVGAPCPRQDLEVPASPRAPRYSSMNDDDVLVDARRATTWSRAPTPLRKVSEGGGPVDLAARRATTAPGPTPHGTCLADSVESSPVTPGPGIGRCRSFPFGIRCLAETPRGSGGRRKLLFASRVHAWVPRQGPRRGRRVERGHTGGRIRRSGTCSLPAAAGGKGRGTARRPAACTAALSICARESRLYGCDRGPRSPTNASRASPATSAKRRTRVLRVR